MAKEVVLTCDFGRGACKQPAKPFRLWQDGEQQAWAVDLCDEHAATILAIVVDNGTQVDLPVKPRARMEVTKLVTTPKTAHLKKKG